MRYNRLGSTGIFVSELCLGAMTFGDGAGRFAAIGGLGQPESTALVKQAFDAGINFIDTANVYGGGYSERFTGQALKDLGIPRNEVVVATKATGPMAQGINQRGANRYHLLHQIDASLERLGMDHVDLYQIHALDPTTPMEETLRALEDIVRSGRARYIGVSNWGAWHIARALGHAEARGYDKFVSVQAYYTIAGRDLERELVPMMRHENLGLLVWSPLAGGLLSGKFRRTGSGGASGVEGEGRRASFDFPPVDMDHAYAVIEAMAPLAEKRGVSIAQIALSWLLHQDAVTSVIVGAKRADQLADNIAACDVELTAAELADLDKVSMLKPEYPGWMFATQMMGADQSSPRRRPK